MKITIKTLEEMRATEGVFEDQIGLKHEEGCHFQTTGPMTQLCGKTFENDGKKELKELCIDGWWVPLFAVKEIIKDGQN
jgi:hypothetical protein